MVQSVKATYRDGVLEPSESLDLEDGDVVTLSISEVNGAGDDEGLESASVGVNSVGNSAPVDAESQKPTDFQALHERIRKIRESVPGSAWENVPKDSARNKKHYLYGHPKEDEK